MSDMDLVDFFYDQIASGRRTTPSGVPVRRIITAIKRRRRIIDLVQLVAGAMAVIVFVVGVMTFVSALSNAPVFL